MFNPDGLGRFTFAYQGDFPFMPPNGVRSNCRVRVYRRMTHQAIVEFSESYVPEIGVTNPGTSITNSAAMLINMAWAKLKDGPLDDAQDVSFLERYHDVGGSRFAWIEGSKFVSASLLDMMELLGPEAVAE